MYGASRLWGGRWVGGPGIEERSQVVQVLFHRTVGAGLGYQRHWRYEEDGCLAAHVGPASGRGGPGGAAVAPSEQWESHAVMLASEGEGRKARLPSHILSRYSRESQDARRHCQERMEVGRQAVERMSKCRLQEGSAAVLSEGAWWPDHKWN